MNKKNFVIASFISILIIVSYFIWIKFFYISSVEPGADGLIVITQINQDGILTGNKCSPFFVNKQADYIIQGKLDKIETYWNEDNTTHTVSAMMNIDKYIKGKHFKVDKIIIKDMLNFGKPTADEELNNVMGISDRPIFNEGKKVNMYLVESSNKLQVLCGKDGVEEL